MIDFVCGFVLVHLHAHVPFSQLCVEERHNDDLVTLLYRAAEHIDRLGDDVVPNNLVDSEEICGVPPASRNKVAAIQKKTSLLQSSSRSQMILSQPELSAKTPPFSIKTISKWTYLCKGTPVA